LSEKALESKMMLRRLSVMALMLVATPALAQEADYIARYAGSFSGGGTVRQSADEGAHDVSCNLDGTAEGNRLTFSGSCRALVIFSREVGADVTADESGVYSGTYTGSRIGSAAVSGRRQGDSVVLDVTWPQEVNGDNHAVMTITNSGSGGFSIQVVDRDGADGPEVVVTDVTVSGG
jgi:hypothetical protein